MMKVSKRFIAMLTVLILSVFLSSSAMAATVCKIGKKGYSSLPAAVGAVKNGQTIKVTKAIKSTERVEIQNGKKFTIDFSGKKYSFTSPDGNYAFGIAPGVTVTVKNLNLVAKPNAFQIDGTLNLVSGKMTAGFIKVMDDGATKGTLNIKGGTYSITKESDSGPWLDNNGSVKITKGTFKKTADMRNQGKLSITGGSFQYTGGHSILHGNGGTAVISGGTFQSTASQIIDNSNTSKLTIKGGTFKAKNNAVLFNAENATVTISGGTFTRTENNGPMIDCKGLTKISGGTFKGGLSFQGKATLTGGKTTNRVIANPNANVTIKKFTVNQGKTPPAGPPFSNATLIAAGGKITVKGGSFISKNGTGYDAVNGG